MNSNFKMVEEILLEKQAKRFLDSVSHVSYLLDNTEKEIGLLKTNIDRNEVKIYVYFDDGVKGIIKNISLIDKEGDKITIMDKEIVKEEIKGFYVLFSYKFERGEN